ncbi:MAG TPA: fused MFS/spermidine synthase, partial [Burkholderiales bacterium]|nr:fused MFS/spermidine synthase [Burkholderiales bacterium]
LLSLASLPIIANADWKPTGADDPVWRILGLLAATIGLPYFMLSTTGPLVQSWFAREHADPALAKRVYRLFALSNFGSLVGLLAYPFAIEMWVPTRTQAIGWSCAYGLFVLLCSGCAWRARSRAPDAIATASEGEIAPGLLDYLKWLVLAALASLLLLVISSHISQNVASIPFLWVLPLTLYLLTFVLCFEGRGGQGWYFRPVWLLPCLALMVLMNWGLTADRGVLHIDYAIPLYCGGLFAACMFCHGELAHAKPAPRYLTRFYLMLSVGGATGGMTVAFIVPRIFTGNLEMPIAITACALMALLLCAKQIKSGRMFWAPLVALAATAGAGYYAWNYQAFLHEDTILARRNFYGSLRVKQTAPETDPDAERRLVHGVIMHGEQYVNPKYRGLITSYYGESSGLGMALQRFHPVQQRVGMVGLGAGTIAGYAEPGDFFKIYEINPQVIDIASFYFYYVPEARGKVEMALGDARLTLERQGPQNFDVLAIDAFSSDAIPVHLITREAMRVYLKNIKPDGAIAFHVTNRYLQLAPVVKQLADEVGYQAVLISDEPSETYLSRTDWVIVTKSRNFLDDPEIKAKRSEIIPIPGLQPWTDDFNNLFQILKTDDQTVPFGPAWWRGLYDKLRHKNES